MFDRYSVLGQHTQNHENAYRTLQQWSVLLRAYNYIQQYPRLTESTLFALRVSGCCLPIKIMSIKNPHRIWRRKTTLTTVEAKLSFSMFGPETNLFIQATETFWLRVLHLPICIIFYLWFDFPGWLIPSYWSASTKTALLRSLLFKEILFAGWYAVL